jgi:hypothetical protein
LSPGGLKYFAFVHCSANSTWPIRSAKITKYS